MKIHQTAFANAKRDWNLKRKEDNGKENRRGWPRKIA
jgi:hypothetical protein